MHAPEEWNDPNEALMEELAEADLEHQVVLADGAKEVLADLIGAQVEWLQDNSKTTRIYKTRRPCCETCSSQRRPICLQTLFAEECPPVVL